MSFMLLAALGAGFIGYVFEAAVLMFLFSLSNTLEVYTMGRTRRALHALLKLRPARALVRRDRREIEVEAESVRVGERVIVKPGEAIPVDGAVALGASLVDQSSLTGESVPVRNDHGSRAAMTGRFRRRRQACPARELHLPVQVQREAFAAWAIAEEITEQGATLLLPESVPEAPHPVQLWQPPTTGFSLFVLLVFFEGFFQRQCPDFSPLIGINSALGLSIP